MRYAVEFCDAADGEWRSGWVEPKTQATLEAARRLLAAEIRDTVRNMDDEEGVMLEILAAMCSAAEVGQEIPLRCSDGDVVLHRIVTMELEP